MLLGSKLRRLLWRARRLTVDLWGAATTERRVARKALRRSGSARVA